MRFIDPDGMRIDDYFNWQGKYLGSDGAKTDYVQIISQRDWDRNKIVDKEGNESISHDAGAYESDNIAKVSLSDNAVENIVKHYDSQVDGVDRNARTQIKSEQLSNKNTLMQSQKGGQQEIFGITIKDPDPKIVVNTQDGKVHSELNTASNIKNTLVHELDHQVAPTMSTPQLELRAIDAQRNHSTYSGTTSSYKKLIDNYEKYYKK